MKTPFTPTKVTTTIGDLSKEDQKEIFDLMKKGKREELRNNSHVHSISS